MRVCIYVCVCCVCIVWVAQCVFGPTANVRRYIGMWGIEYVCVLPLLYLARETLQKGWFDRCHMLFTWCKYLRNTMAHTEPSEGHRKASHSLGKATNLLYNGYWGGTKVNMHPHLYSVCVYTYVNTYSSWWWCTVGNGAQYLEWWCTAEGCMFKFFFVVSRTVCVCTVMPPWRWGVSV
jgi:hypothetical protein